MVHPSTSRSAAQELEMPVGNQLLEHQAARCRRPPTVTIVEQPACKALRFRYLSENRYSTISGVNSIRGNKTYPTIRVDNYIGRITIVVSCVTKEKPYRPHPHNLVGKPGLEGFKYGAYTMEAEVTDKENEFEFNLLRVLNVTHKNIKASLEKRAQGGVDPFGTGFKHVEESKDIQLLDLSAIRLAFQVFLHGPQGRDKIPLKPIVSNVMFDKKAPDLHIFEVIGISKPVHAETPIVLLCDKVNSKNTAVVVYEKDKHGFVKWHEHARITTIHKQTAIVAEIPPYNPPYYEPLTDRATVTLKIQLRSLIKNKRSNSVAFEYIPDGQARADSIPRNITYAPLASSSSKAQWQTISQDTTLDSTPSPSQALIHQTERVISPFTGGVDESSFEHKLLLGTRSPVLESVEVMPPPGGTSVEAQSPQLNGISVFHVPSPNRSLRNIHCPFQVESAETFSMDGLSLSPQNLLLEGTVKEADLLGLSPARSELNSNLNEISGMSSAYETSPITHVRGVYRPFSTRKSSLKKQASKRHIRPQFTQLGETRTGYVAHGSLVNTHSSHLGGNNGSRGPHVFSELYENQQLPHVPTSPLCVTHFPQQSQPLEEQQSQESLTTNEVIDSDKLMDLDSSELVQMINKDPNSELHDLSEFLFQEDSESLSGSLRRLSTNS